MKPGIKEEALFLFEARLNDIRQWKEEQWRYTHIALLGLVGLFASVRAPAASPPAVYKILVAIAAVGIVLIWDRAHISMEAALARSREGLYKLRSLLHEEVRATLPEGKRDNNTIPAMQRWAVFGAAAFVVVASLLRS